MWRFVIAVVVLVAGCGVEQPESGARVPTCAELGCRWAASGTSDRWSPCTDGQCWCTDRTKGPNDLSLACTRTPCAEGPQLCAAGQHAEHADYTGGSVCFCMADGQ